MIQKDFPHAPDHEIRGLLQHNSQLLLPTYLALHRLIHDPGNGGTKPKWAIRSNNCRRPKPPLLDLKQVVANFELESGRISPNIREFPEELVAARRLSDSVVPRRRSKRQKEAEEKRLDEEAFKKGQVCECQCCFSLFPILKMIHCDADSDHVRPNRPHGPMPQQN